MKLIIGLGNPGTEYARTRHNVGFVVLDHLCYTHAMQWNEKGKFKAEVAEGEIGSNRIMLAKPQTFMNGSGESVRTLVDFYKIKHHDILVIHDDADVEFGKARLVQGGNDGGHRGVVSLYQHGFEDTWRLKIGVSNERRQPGQAIDFVLTRFEQAEWDQLSHLMEAATRKVTDFAGGTIAPESFTWL